MTLDRARIDADFAEAVNMDADELEAWLETPESRRVGRPSYLSGSCPQFIRL